VKIQLRNNNSKQQPDFLAKLRKKRAKQLKCEPKKEAREFIMRYGGN
jgi:hypothetical protein